MPASAPAIGWRRRARLGLALVAGALLAVLGGGWRQLLAAAVDSEQELRCRFYPAVIWCPADWIGPRLPAADRAWFVRERISPALYASCMPTLDPGDALLAAMQGLTPGEIIELLGPPTEIDHHCFWYSSSCGDDALSDSDSAIFFGFPDGRMSGGLGYAN